MIEPGELDLYRMGGRGSISAGIRDIFSSSQCPDWLWGTPGLLSNIYREVKQLGLEDNQSHLFTDEVKKGGAIHHLPHTYLRHDVLAI